MSHEDTLRCIELFGSEVLPALRADEPSQPEPERAVAQAPAAVR
jgi:hypothetical protein